MALSVRRLVAWVIAGALLITVALATGEEPVYVMPVGRLRGGD